MTDSIRLDPSPSRVFSWILWLPDAPVILDDRDRVLRPAGPTLVVRYRSTGAEWEFWPVFQDEAQTVMNPGPLYDYSIGKAFGDIIKAHKSGRLIKPGERQSTVKQREETEARAGRRWLA